MRKIYLDYSATTPLDPVVLKKMLPYFSREFANPASIHSLGQAVLRDVEDARHKIAQVIGAKASEIIFTSGATEANNLALRGVLQALKNKGDKRKEIITTKIEHSSVIEPCADLLSKGYKVRRLGVDSNGLVKTTTLQKAITKDTILVSIGYLNSEIGAIQSIDKLARVIRKINERRYSDWLKAPSRQRGEKPRPIYFHTDATQAFNAVPCRVDLLNVDLMSLSAHKIYGPKGIGFLYLKKDTPLEAIIRGGHQEKNLRSGTLNVPGIIGLTEALILADKKRKYFNAYVSKLRNDFVKQLLKKIPQARLTIDLKDASCFHANIIFPGVSGDSLLFELDQKGLEVSTGSACASGDLEASPVLVALGYSEKEASSAIRFTFGKLTKTKDVKDAVLIVAQAYNLCLKRA